MSVQFHARIPIELAKRFEVARRLDQRTRSDALRLAMNTYIEEIAGSHAIENENDAPAVKAERGSRDAANAVEGTVR